MSDDLDDALEDFLNDNHAAAYEAAWLDDDTWSRMSIINAARSGKFSSDRAIEQYCDDIWNVEPMPVTL